MSLKKPILYTQRIRDTDPSVLNVIQEDCQSNAEQINLFPFLLST